jgi:hypothetical protein
VGRGTAWAMLAACAALLTGCTADRAAPAAPAPSPVATHRLDASVTQFRFDEGTHRLKAGVSNRAARDVRISRATISWSGMAFPTVPLSSDPIPPGQATAFTISYGAPQCAQPPTRPPVLVATVDGRTRRLPLRVEDPGLLRRLRLKACAEQLLRRAVRVHWRVATRTVHRAGQEYLPATLVLRHRPGSVDRVAVVDLGGSVLVELRPRAGREALPARLAAHRPALVLPVLLGSGHRCDGHALSQSSQTFLFSAYLRLDDRPTQREILPVSAAERDRIIGVVHRSCR